MIILGIETSCDETAVSVVEAKGDLKSFNFKILGSSLNSQVKLHTKYGGVVPNLAKREHQKNLLPVLIEALRKASLISNFQFSIFNEFSNLEEFLNKIKKPNIDLIAVTVGPGLEPALWTGINFAEKLGKKWNIPVIPTNHLEGHLISVLLHSKIKAKISNQTVLKKTAFKTTSLKFPALGLLISGGHTELIFLKSWTKKKKIGETQDDAVGEAFDKVARMLGLPYPGGPEISKLAEEAQAKNIYLETKFPRPMIHSGDFNFSFSGLKTAVLYYLKNLQKTSREQLSERDWRESEEIFQQKNTPVVRENVFADSTKLAVAREFEDAVIETLISKTKMALEGVSRATLIEQSSRVAFDTPKTLIIGGGVIANKALRKNFLKLKENYPDLQILIPEKSLTTDNATMIAAAGYIEYLRNQKPNRELKAQGNLNIS